MSKVYISGKITGLELEDAEWNFDFAILGLEIRHGFKKKPSSKPFKYNSISRFEVLVFSYV